jgi:hypothetical protein
MPRRHLSIGEAATRREHAHEAFGYAKKSLLALGKTWPVAQPRSQTVATWLHRFYGGWVRLGRSSPLWY